MRGRTAILASAVIAVLLAVALGAWWKLASNDGYKAVINGVRVGADDRELIVVVEMTDCEQLGRTDVEESSTTVGLAVYVEAKTDCGTAVGTPRDIRVVLDTTLGSRTVVDADTGTPIIRTDG